MMCIPVPPQFDTSEAAKRRPDTMPHTRSRSCRLKINVFGTDRERGSNEKVHEVMYVRVNESEIVSIKTLT